MASMAVVACTSGPREAACWHCREVVVVLRGHMVVGGEVAPGVEAVRAGRTAEEASDHMVGERKGVLAVDCTVGEPVE